jgi:hypothetical protein
MDGGRACTLGSLLEKALRGNLAAIIGSVALQESHGDEEQDTTGQSEQKHTDNRKEHLLVAYNDAAILKLG